MQAGRQEYLVEVLVGSNPSSQAAFNVILDTGTGDLMVFSEAYCEKSAHHIGTCLPGSFKSNALIHYALTVDGRVSNITAARHITQTTLVGAPSPPTPEDAVVLVVVEDSSQGPTGSAYWNGTDGSLGLSYGAQSLLAAQPFKQMTSAISPLVFALDFNPPSEKSSLLLGGSYQDISWSETSFTRTPSLFELELYHLSVCGVDLFSNYSSHWKAIVDTGASCLSLPGQFFDMVLSWVENIMCEYEIEGTGQVYLCYYTGPADIPLPTLTFQLGETSTPLHLPLSSLLIPQDTGPPRLCIHRNNYISVEPLSAYNIPRVSLGSMALKSLFTVMDMDNVRVGIRSKLPPPDVDTDKAHCAAKVECTGAQIYYAAANTCVDPECGAYHFQEVNPETKRCRMRTEFQVIISLTFAAFLYIEVVLARLRVKLTRTVLTTIPPT